ncbi:hypothetical protein AD949_02065 [Acetobacter orleanensis]|nr:hypothetical protein AD949_02065 [Acetobacter orleanensis]
MIEVVANSGKLVAYATQFLGNRSAIMTRQFCTGEQRTYPVGRCGMALSASDMVPAHQLVWRCSDGEAGCSRYRHDWFLLA